MSDNYLSINEEKPQFKSIHHSFDVDLAAEFGMEEAVLIHHFQHWISVNKRLKRNFHEGRTWTYQTLEEIAAHFPYISKKQTERLINKLVSKKVLIKGNFNRKKFDRTIWYALWDEKRFLNDEIDIPESGNGYPGIGTPIPDTKTNTKTLSKEKILKERSLSPEQAPLASKEAHVSSSYIQIQDFIDRLLSSILSLRPEYKITESQLKEWELEFDKMLRIDKRNLNEITKVLEWLPTNEFWRSNILSCKTFRKQYDKLCIACEKEESSVPRKLEDTIVYTKD